MLPLPIDEVLPALRAAVRAHGAVVLEAPPGTGKTTRVPWDLAQIVEGQVWVLEPRRVAARAAATRVAAERGEVVGGPVGYAMRHERRAGPDTRVLYVTEALLTRRLAEDPSLRGVGAVVLDEFHERSVHADTAAAWVRAVRVARPDLALVVMSATLDGERVAAWLGCPRVRAEGTLFPVDIEYYAREDTRPIEARVVAAVRAALASPGGDILAFLPGIGEIERAAAGLAGVGADVLPLHGELEGDQQDRALRAGPRRRVVLATNVAETSVTVEGVDTVIDTGLARVAGHDPWTGLGTLEVQPIPRAGCAQRAGRAGRLGPGRCIRLYTRADHDTRPAALAPELARVDLAGVVLDLAVAGARDLAWLDPPPAAAWRAAHELLRRLGALDDDDRPTDRGRAMARLPAHPRLARLLLEGAALGAAREAVALATGLGGRGRREAHDPVDAALRGEGGDPRERRQIEGLLRDHRGASGAVATDTALRLALFAAFPDRVGRRRGGVVVLAEGGRAEIDPATPGGDGVVVVSDVDRVGGRVRARALTAIPEDWLVDRAEVVETMAWAGERVEVREQLRYGAVVLEDAPGRGDAAKVSAFLHDHLVPVAHRVFPDHEKAALLARRVAWLRGVGVDVPELALADVIRAACEGCRSFADLSAVSLLGVARAHLGAAAARVDALAPEHVALPNRARAPVEYPADQDPYVASRLQDFFGLRDGPKVADGRGLVLHLLAPNQRPVQVTADLAGFWERHYPGIRRELMRRYPRHKWPEDPRSLYRDDA